MTDLITIRLGYGNALGLAGLGKLWPYLTEKGLDVRTMSCREDGPDLVYEGHPIAENTVTKRNIGGGE